MSRAGQVRGHWDQCSDLEAQIREVAVEEERRASLETV